MMRIHSRKPARRSDKARWFHPRMENLEGRALPSGSSIFAHPFLHVLPDTFHGTPPTTALTPGLFRRAYAFGAISFPTTSGPVVGDGTGETIAIVDAYDNPYIAADLKAFDKKFGLAAPPSFLKIDQRGVPIVDTTDVSPDQGWGLEIALDVEWAHSVAPKASIVLVEADSNSFSDLWAAVDTAKAYPGVAVVSMSFGASESYFNPVTAGYDATFTQPASHNPVSFVASSGDDGGTVGYGPAANYPSSSPLVLGVGGTSLTLTTDGHYSSETAWSGSGGGQSLYEPEPTYQSSVQHSGFRQSPDVALDADPSTGVAVLDSFGYSGNNGWFQVGGTSLSAPAWAAFIAVADQGRALNSLPTLGNIQADVYALTATKFNDVSTGSNSVASAAHGFDLVTGRGTIRGNIDANALATLVETPPAAAVAHIATVGTKSGSGKVTNPFVAVAIESAQAVLAPITHIVAQTGSAQAITTLAAQNIATPVANDTKASPDLTAATPIILAHSTITGDSSEIPPDRMEPVPADAPAAPKEQSESAPALEMEIQVRDSFFVSDPVFEMPAAEKTESAAPLAAADVVTVEPLTLAGSVAVLLGAYARSEQPGQESWRRKTISV